MVDPLKARLEKLRKIHETTHRRANLYSDVAKNLMQLAATQNEIHIYLKDF